MSEKVKNNKARIYFKDQNKSLDIGLKRITGNLLEKVELIKCKYPQSELLNKVSNAYKTLTDGEMSQQEKAMALLGDKALSASDIMNYKDGVHFNAKEKREKILYEYAITSIILDNQEVNNKCIFDFNNDMELVGENLEFWDNQDLQELYKINEFFRNTIKQMF